VILVFPIALGACVAWLWRRRNEDGADGRGWGWFLGWAAAGAAMTFSFLTGFSIGLLILPGALALLYLLARRSPRWREASGFAAGIGLILLFVAFLHRGDRPCPANGLVLPSGKTSISCGGADRTRGSTRGLSSA
jgi:4-amino-4-deoxy-L-arabinose transferase-like glycosyltransferase